MCCVWDWTKDPLSLCIIKTFETWHYCNGVLTLVCSFIYILNHTFFSCIQRELNSNETYSQRLQIDDNPLFTFNTHIHILYYHWSVNNKSHCCLYLVPSFCAWMCVTVVLTLNTNVIDLCAHNHCIQYRDAQHQNKSTEC